MGIEVTGTIHTIFDTKQVSERFSKREFVLELADNPKYPQMVLFQLTGDRCAQIDDFRVGDKVLVEFSLRGREWRSGSGELKYFNSLDVWRVEALEERAGRRGGSHDSPPPRDNGGGYMPEPPRDAKPGDIDDIPFLSCELAHEPSPIARVIR